MPLTAKNPHRTASTTAVFYASATLNLTQNHTFFLINVIWGVSKTT